MRARTTLMSPHLQNVEGVISVGAYDGFSRLGQDSSIGSYLDPTTNWIESGNQKPEILAPGSYILSTVSSQKSPPYAYSTGTSDAAIFVTATLALILQDLTDKGLIDLTIDGDDRIFHVKKALRKRSTSQKPNWT